LFQICRFHLIHSDFHSGFPSFSEPGSDEESNEDLEWDIDEKIMAHGVNDAIFTLENTTTHVELLKTIGMLNIKFQTYCKDCQPLILETPGWQGWCKCSLHSHFVAPWRCIPCVLSEEAQLIASQQKYTVTRDPEEPERRWMYEKVSFAPCSLMHV
jgi:hypothetical protein